MTYLGDPVTQLDGSTYAHKNCVAASGSELGDCHTLGYWNVKPATIRSLSGNTTTGLRYSEAIDAIKKATGGEVVLTPLYWVAPSALDDAINAPRVVAISIDCSVTRYTPYRTGTYTGRHCVTVGAKRVATITRADGTTYQQKQAYVMDPGHTTVKWVWWPWSLLIKAAVAATGNNTINIYYTRDLAGVSRVAKSTGAVRSTPTVTATNIVGRVVAGTAYTVQDTVKGGYWTYSGHDGKGWSKIGTNRYTHGGRVR